MTETKADNQAGKASPASADQEHIVLLVTRGVVGGAQMAVVHLANELQRQGKHVTVAAGDGSFVETECQRRTIPFQRAPWLQRSLNPLHMLNIVRHSRRFIAEMRPTVLHLTSSNTLFAAVGARLSNRHPRIIFTVQGLSVVDDNYKSRWIRVPFRLLFRLLFRFVDQLVFVSEVNRQEAERFKLANDAVIVHNALDEEELPFEAPSQARQHLAELLGRDLTNRIVIGSLGRLAYQKNYGFLIEQVAKLKHQCPRMLVVIVGDGPERNHLERMIESRGVAQHVAITGEIENASRYMKGFDIFTLLSRYEGLSITLIEALFAGLPVLASDVGGAREQFSHAPFQVYPFNDAHTYTARMKELIQSPRKRESLAQANAARATDFEIRRIGRQYLAIYSGQTSQEPGGFSPAIPAESAASEAQAQQTSG
jgi:glycosyltransferase involved in cell wall biosynthesis